MLLEKIDTLVLDRVFTPFAWRFERLTGRTNFFLAWLCFGVVMLTEILSLGLKASLTHDLEIMDIFFGPLLIIALAYLLHVVSHEDERAQRGSRATGTLSYHSVGSMRLTIVLAACFSSVQLLEQMHGFASLITDPKVLEQCVWCINIWTYLWGAYFMSVRRPPYDWGRKKNKTLSELVIIGAS